MGKKKRRTSHQWVREDLRTDHPEESAQPARKSRTQRRDDARALDGLGKELVAMPDSRLDRLPLSTDLRDAIAHARTITSHEAGRRQMQLIGKMLRSEDPDALRIALADDTAASRQRDRALGRWQRRILEEGAPAIEAFLLVYPDADRQRLRALWRAAAQSPDKKAGALLRYLYEAAPQ